MWTVANSDGYDGQGEVVLPGIGYAYGGVPQPPPPLDEDTPMDEPDYDYDGDSVQLKCAVSSAADRHSPSAAP